VVVPSVARWASVRPFRSKPEPWRADVDLGQGERVLLARDTPSGWVVATTHALWLPDRTGLTRVGWESVDNASWDRDTSALTVRQSAVLGARPRRWVVHMDDDRDLLLLIKERVRATLVTTRHVRLDADHGVAVVARRPPGSDALEWRVSVDAGVDLDDPDVRSRIDEELRGLKAELGQ
jgi:hypothetical protein